MKITIIVAIAAVSSIITTMLLVPLLAKGKDVPVSHETVVYVPQPKLSPKQIIWLAKLMRCESGIDAKAVNPLDLDGTPSYGVLQFKPSTYAGAAKHYKMASTTNYMSAEGQVSIVERWILDGGTDWSHQFPDCVRQFGLPPK